MAIKRYYSLSRALNSIDTRNSPEFEDSFPIEKNNQEWKDRFGIEAKGARPGCRQISVPWSKLQTRDLTTATGASGAFTVGTDVPEIQASLRPTSLLMKLPITVLENCQGNVVLPRISTGVSPSALTEIQSFTSSDPAFGAANAGPQRMSAAVYFSRRLLAQAAGNEGIDRVLTTELKRAISFQIDTYLLQGTGINAQPIGVHRFHRFR